MVHGFDLSAGARRQLEAVRGKAYDTPAAAVASADTVILMLLSSDIVERVLLDDTVLARLEARIGGYRHEFFRPGADGGAGGQTASLRFPAHRRAGFRWSAGCSERQPVC